MSKAPFACAFCGKPAQRDTERVWNPHAHGLAGDRDRAEAAGTTKHTWRYQGNKTVLRTDWWRPGDWAGPNDKPFISSVHVWDGQTWRLDRGDFCSIRCAEDFARAALRAGYRMKKDAA